MKDASSAQDFLEHALDHSAHLLPMQGPIGVFIHHNTLHSFQHLLFEDAVVAASGIYGTQPYLKEADYQALRKVGRIVDSDLDVALADDACDMVRAWFDPASRPLTISNLRWYADEKRYFALPEIRDLYQEAKRRLPPFEQAPAGLSKRLRDSVLFVDGLDTDAIVNPLLIHLCAAFTDQGMAYWPMPNRDEGLLVATQKLFSNGGLINPPGFNGLDTLFQRVQGMSAADIVLDVFQQWDVPTSAFSSLIELELLALPGWAGLIRRLEVEPSLAPYLAINASLMDFLAIRLLLTVAACAEHQSTYATWQRPHHGDSDFYKRQRMVEAGNIATLMARLNVSLNSPDSVWDELITTTRKWDDLQRRRVLHLAYEHRHALSVLGPLSRHRIDGGFSDPEKPSAQVFFCIDEREESARRALEEAAPDIETFGAAGFFGVAVHYQGADDAHGAAFCPIVVTPQHAVSEHPLASDEHIYKVRQQRRKHVARTTLTTFKGSRTLFRGTLVNLVLGLPTLVPLVANVVAPGTFGKLLAKINSKLLPSPTTMLGSLHEGNTYHGLQQGFTLDEKADRVAGMLNAAGLVKDTARMVVILGHGSTSLNNPHESAHDCGACGGRRGGVNARLFAAMANNPDVRKLLPARGVTVSDDTRFVGGYHDTSSDEVTLYDIAVVPATHADDLELLRINLDKMRAGNALERARRFEAADGYSSPDSALVHVEDRAFQLSEPRPEYGHCTNAVCIVGRRASTRGLFLDRRAFLVSYDAKVDPKVTSLTALLGAAGPVCAGINLEYYFSYVDNERYGCGTKLPHNVVGLVGVMNGFRSDLRTGLPWQMVEIHEPVRLLLVVEASPENLWTAISNNPNVTELVTNRWIRVASMNPDSGLIKVWKDGVWTDIEPDENRLPVVNSSGDWFLGRMEHLPMARIEVSK